MDQNSFIKGIELCIQSTTFKYNNQVYKQISGLPMGSPMSAVLANLVLEDMECELLQNTTINISFYKRYVDDITLGLHDKDINTLLNIFNNYNPNLKFTIEKIKNNRINFLDMTLIKNINKTDTIWYTKEIWSGRYLNYFSTCSLKYKVSVVIGLTGRALRLTSPKYRKETIDKIKIILKHNSYPEHLINKIIKKRTFYMYNTTKKKKL